MSDYTSKCAGITERGKACKRSGTRHFVDKDGYCTAHYCGQHAAGKGVMRMLLPQPWEYDRVEVYTYGTGV